MFKKAINSEGIIPIGGEDLNKKYSPGFSYQIEGVIYTVDEIVTKDAGSHMRKVTTNKGDTEIMLVESIDKDMKEPDCKILSKGELPKEEEKEEEKDK